MSKEFEHKYLPLTAKWQEDSKGYIIFDSDGFAIQLVEQETIENSSEWQKVNLEYYELKFSKADLEWLENVVDFYKPYDVIEFKTKIKYSIYNLKQRK